MATSNPGRVVVLTGANEGIGSHMLTALVEDGHRVAALDVAGDNVRAVRDRSPERVLFAECDVTDDEAVRAAVRRVTDRWGRIDVLVNNAAVATVGAFGDQAMADTRREFEVNVFGYVRMIRAVLPGMLDRDAGVIHNLGSAVGDLGHPGLSGYAATKGAIKALVRSLRLELRHTGVSCTLMVPPAADTGMTAPLGYPAWMTRDPATVGRQLAGKLESTRAVITPDRRTRLALALLRRVPSLWSTITDRVVDLEG